MGSYIRTEEHRKRMSDLKRNQVFTNAWKENISKNHADLFSESNPNWKGGISKVEQVCLGCNNVFITKLCRVKSGRGKFCSKTCYSLWQSKNIRGVNHPGFSGKTSIQKQIRCSKAYKIWRDNIYFRDKYSCVLCGIKGGWNKSMNKKIILNADHIYPLGIILRKEKINEWQEVLKNQSIWDLNNGRTLCVECHSKTSTYLNSHMIVRYKNI